ncbi:hypothetical protein AB833_28780 [Chromatiales bacterium (ex Bugula neritina AB1)]|nr:hypothetical protein AB833_28780 [Chromatiales bacterium (ex Bugula neritina AB1)]
MRAETAVRPAQSADVSAIESCAKSAYSMYVERIGREPAPMLADFNAAVESDKVVVVCSGLTIAGYVIYYPRDNVLFLENIAIRPCRQRQGLGEQLLKHVCKTAIDNGLTAVELYTNAKMTENLAWYEKHGFQEMRRVHEDGFDRVYFRKALV